MKYTIILGLIMLALSPRSVAGILTSAVTGAVSFSSPTYTEAGQRAVSAALIQSGVARKFDSAESESVNRISGAITSRIGKDAVSAIGVTALVARTLRDKSIVLNLNGKALSLGVNSIGLNMIF